MRGFLGSTWRPPRQTLGARCRAECQDSSVPGGRAWTGSDLQTEQPLLRARIRVRRGHTVGYGGDCREPLGQCRTQRTRGRGDRRGSGGGTRGPAAAVGPGGAAGGPVGLHVVRLHSAWARGSRDQAGHCRDTVTRHGTVALPRTRTPPLCLPSVPRAAVSQAPRPPTRAAPTAARRPRPRPPSLPRAGFRFPSRGPAHRKCRPQRHVSRASSLGAPPRDRRFKSETWRRPARNAARSNEYDGDHATLPVRPADVPAAVGGPGPSRVAQAPVAKACEAPTRRMCVDATRTPAATHEERRVASVTIIEMTPILAAEFSSWLCIYSRHVCVRNHLQRWSQIEFNLKPQIS